MEADAGGIRGLVAAVTERWHALEADFQSTYRIDLARAVWADGMGVRRLGVLIAGLPASARFRVPESGGWTITDHLLALQVEQTDAVYRAVFASIPRSRPVTQPKPLRIPRPGAKAATRIRPRDLVARLLGGR